MFEEHVLLNKHAKDWALRLTYALLMYTPQMCCCVACAM